MASKKPRSESNGHFLKDVMYKNQPTTMMDLKTEIEMAQLQGRMGT